MTTSQLLTLNPQLCVAQPGGNRYQWTPTRAGRMTVALSSPRPDPEWQAIPAEAASRSPRGPGKWFARAITGLALAGVLASANLTGLGLIRLQQQRVRQQLSSRLRTTEIQNRRLAEANHSLKAALAFQAARPAPGTDLIAASNARPRPRTNTRS